MKKFNNYIKNRSVNIKELALGLAMVALCVSVARYLFSNFLGILGNICLLIVTCFLAFCSLVLVSRDYKTEKMSIFLRKSTCIVLLIAVVAVMIAMYPNLVKMINFAINNTLN